MRTYCTLIISSDTDPKLGATVQTVLGLNSSDVVDTQTPEFIAKREKLAKIMGTSPPTPPRYFWRFSSMDAIESIDVQTHIAWLLDQVNPGRSIQEICEHESKAYLTCFWAGNGRGGGPVLSSKLTQAVADHGVELRFDFYVEEDEVSA